jgi:hypothetical protein
MREAWHIFIFQVVAQKNRWCGSLAESRNRDIIDVPSYLCIDPNADFLNSRKRQGSRRSALA